MINLVKISKARVITKTLNQRKRLDFSYQLIIWLEAIRALILLKLSKGKTIKNNIRTQDFRK